MKHNQTSAAFAVSVITLLLSAPLGAQTPWFPLEPGLSWTYAEAGRDGGERTVTVTGKEGDLFVVNFQGTETRLGFDGPGEVDIDIPEEGLQTYYRFEQDSWTHRDVRTCEDGRTMTIVSRSETVDTPFAQFTNCIKIEYGPESMCADAGVAVEWWAEDTGLVKWAENSFIGPREYVLTNFSSEDPSPTFRRGDANTDGQTNISDPVLVLNWLFLGDDPPICRDSADANDDGETNLSDAIAILDFLFLGRGTLPAPGPDECGLDPTEDDIPDCGPGSCGGASLTGG